MPFGNVSHSKTVAPWGIYHRDVKCKTCTMNGMKPRIRSSFICICIDTLTCEHHVIHRGHLVLCSLFPHVVQDGARSLIMCKYSKGSSGSDIEKSDVTLKSSSFSLLT